jgi:hypothetical protein
MALNKESFIAKACKYRSPKHMLIAETPEALYEKYSDSLL